MVGHFNDLVAEQEAELPGRNGEALAIAELAKRRCLRVLGLIGRRDIDLAAHSERIGRAVDTFRVERCDQVFETRRKRLAAPEAACPIHVRSSLCQSPSSSNIANRNAI